MKTKILLFGLFLSSIFCFGQKKGETVTTEWLKHPCYNGIEYKVINYNYKNNDGEAYWGIIIRNGYGAPLSCAYSLKVGGVSWGSGFDNTYELASGKTFSHSDGGLVTAMNFKSSSTNFTFEVKDVKVGDTKFACENGRQINLSQKEKNETYQQNQYQTASELVERKNQLCTELRKLVKGQANNVYPICQAQTYDSGDVNKLKHEVKLLEDEIHKLKYEDSSNKGIANQTTTNSNNQQTEQQRQQQENQRIANQSQQFINVYNEGVDLQRLGNFTGAQEKYQQAIGLATNETQRQQAQSAYDDMVKTSNKQVAINTITDGLVQIGTILDNAHEKKMQKWKDEREEHDRKEAIIKADKAINTLSDPKIFETYADYIAKNLEALGFTFEKITFFNNGTDGKTAQLEFKGIQVDIINQWLGVSSGMQKIIIFKAENVATYSKIANSTLFNNLRALYPFYDENKKNGTIKESFDYTSFILIGIEKTEPFIDIYNKGYKSANYKGFTAIVKDFEIEANTKLAQTDNSVQGLVEKASLYENGSSGVEKNYQKALEFYQQAYEKSNDKELLLKIGYLYNKGDIFLSKNQNIAIEYYENCLNNSNLKSNLKAVAHSGLAMIYWDTNSQLYNIEKAKYNFEKEISFLEEEFNNQSDIQQKSKLKKRIANTYSSLGLLYNYYGKNVVPEISVVYYQNAMQWNEDDVFTAFTLIEIYSKERKTGSMLNIVGS
jgi:TPR repeat protein